MNPDFKGVRATGRRHGRVPDGEIAHRGIFGL